MYNLDNGMFKISTKKISYISIIQTKPYKRQENVCILRNRTKNCEQLKITSKIFEQISSSATNERN